MKGRDRRFIIDRTLSETLPYQQSVPNQIPGKTNVHGPKRSFIERHPRDVRIDLRPYK